MGNPEIDNRISVEIQVVDAQEQPEFSLDSRTIAENFVGTSDPYEEFDQKLEELLERDPRSVLFERDVDNYPNLAPDPAEDWSPEQIERFRERTLGRIDQYAELLAEHLENISERVNLYELQPKGVSDSYHQFVRNQIHRINRIRETVTGGPTDQEGIFDIRGADRRLSITLGSMVRRMNEARNEEIDYTIDGRKERLKEIELDGNHQPTGFPNIKFADIGQYDSNEVNREIEETSVAHAQTLQAIESTYPELGPEIIDLINSSDITITSKAQVASPGAIASNLDGSDGGYIIDFNELIAEHSSEDLTMVLANEYIDIFGREKYPESVFTPEYQLLGFVFHSNVTSEELLSRRDVVEAFAKPMNLYLLDMDWTRLTQVQRQQLNEMTEMVTRGEFSSFEELKNEARRYEHMSFGDDPGEEEESQ